MSKIPSIAMIPSGYKANKVYSVLPTNGDADLSTTRASTATRVNQLGLIEEVATGVPRLDYTDGGCPSLLVEPQSTNLITYSEDFSNASWVKTQGTVASNTIIAPDGTLTADTFTSTGNFAQLTQNFTGTSATDYTVSFWLKRKTGSGQVAIKSVENINTNVSVTDEWKRFSITTTSTSTNIISAVRLLTIGDEVYVWGAQLEQLSYATSYIPTNGAAATRVAETVSKTGLSSYINSSEGVLYAEISALSTSLDTRAISLSDNTSSNRIFFFYSLPTNSLVATSFVGGVEQFREEVFLSDITIFNKIALKYKENDFALWVNGVEVATVNSGSVFSLNTLNTLAFNSISASPFKGKVKDLRVYNQVLTDAELQTLTS